jgi:hypothetical protein
MHITCVPIITFTDMKQSCSANEHHMLCLSLVLFVCLFVFKNVIIRLEAGAFKFLRNWLFMTLMQLPRKMSRSLL